MCDINNGVCTGYIQMSGTMKRNLRGNLRPCKQSTKTFVFIKLPFENQEQYITSFFI